MDSVVETGLTNIAYVCKYTPIELLAAFGVSAHMVDGEQSDFSLAESRLHANVCCHAKATFQLLCDEQAILLTDCCDSLRRVHDVLKEDKPDCRFLACIELPHDELQCAQVRYAHELARLVRMLEEATGETFSPVRFFAAFDETESAHLPTGDFVALLGARATPSLKAALEECFSLPIVDFTCASFRDIVRPPAELVEASLDELLSWYAGALLHMTPCMRMGDVSGRGALMCAPGLAGIVYNTVKFCDYYAFDYATLQARAAVPLLKVESDFEPPAAGQLATRLEALRELIEPTASSHVQPYSPLPARERVLQRASVSERECATVSNKKYYAGIDSGSTSTNMVVLDTQGKVCATSIVRTGPKAQQGAHAAWEEVRAQLGAAESDFAAIVATGYGRANIPFATSTVTEITCHARGVAHLYPDARCIVDIGGQDSKVICLDGAGSVDNFVMNDKCAAGTGRFLEAMARTLELSLDEMAQKGEHYTRDITISSMCTVFAESEVISLIADNHSDTDIIHGLNKSIASRTAAMVKRAKGTSPFVMTGGVARNKGVVAELARALDAPLSVPDAPDLCGALGAALFAFGQ